MIFTFFDMSYGPMCGDLVCHWKTCARWVGGSFVKATVTLVEIRGGYLCWARPNGVRLLGGDLISKGWFL